MIYGYARTSTTDQVAGIEAQRRDLFAAGVSLVNLWGEQTSAVGEREVLDRLLAVLGKGDILVVTKLDRLARSVLHLSQLLEQIHAAGASLRILALGMDTSTPTGKLMLNVLGSVAQFEREIMLERQAEGIAKARAEGKYTGRKPKARAEEVQGFYAEHVAAGGSKADGIEAAALAFGLSPRQIRRIVF